MIASLSRSFLKPKRSPSINLFSFENWTKKAKELYEDVRNKIEQIDPERKKKYMKYFAGFLFLSYLTYEVKRERAEHISLDQLRQIVKKSESDTLTVHYKMVKQKNRGFKRIDKSFKCFVYCTVNGVDYYTMVKDEDDLQEEVKKMEENKANKTKIIMKNSESFDQEIKKVMQIMVNVCLPLVVPVLLYRSSMGKILTSRILGHSQLAARPNVKFNDIAGLGNAKIQISQLVDFLKSPKKYKDIGAKVPKGALLAGPPGTGKTMLAKACAGEADVPFFSASGSEFVELFAGMGARRVRELFANAKKQTPAIIFIDEIDAIGRKREDKFGGANDERANTLNQLLVEMDGFGTSDDIIVLAATNRKEMLDNALTRPGRFDRIVEIELPDLKGRQQILHIYLNKIKLSTEQTLEEYAKRIATLTFGFSGADLANLCNEAAILAVRKEKTYVEPTDFQSASDRVLAGLEQSTALSEIEKKKVAYHECGHAVTAWFLEGASPLLKITIIPRSKGSLGFAQYLPNQSMLMNKQELQDQLCVILGGRIAEEVFFNEVSNGAADDLQKVRNLAREMITGYGMGQKHENYAPVKTDGNNIYSQQTSAEIDKQMITLIEKSTQRTRDIINKHKDKIEGLAEAVLAKQTLNHRQIRQILGDRPFQSKENYKQFVEGLKNNKSSQII